MTKKTFIVQTTFIDHSRVIPIRTMVRTPARVLLALPICRIKFIEKLRNEDSNSLWWSSVRDLSADWKSFLSFRFFQGESGLGKATLVNSLFLTDLYPERHICTAQGLKRFFKRFSDEISIFHQKKFDNRWKSKRQLWKSKNVEWKFVSPSLIHRAMAIVSTPQSAINQY